ncbi:MAG: helix-turn-helix transcriptional regulator [Gaiellaceae bacterium]
MADPKKELGERIKQARAEKGWKQKHLAARVEVEPITVSRWERGATTPDLEVVRLIAEATQKPVSYFVASGEGGGEAAGGLLEAAARIEAAADRITAESDRLAELVKELGRSLGRE